VAIRKIVDRWGPLDCECASIVTEVDRRDLYDNSGDIRLFNGQSSERMPSSSILMSL
jgi:hypothetical protein